MLALNVFPAIPERAAQSIPLCAKVTKEKGRVDFTILMSHEQELVRVMGVVSSNLREPLDRYRVLRIALRRKSEWHSESEVNGQQVK
jgi:hypothetical protein